MSERISDPEPLTRTKPDDPGLLVDLGGGCFSMGCYFNREAHLARGHKIIGAPFRKPDISAGVAAYLAHNG